MLAASHSNCTIQTSSIDRKRFTKYSLESRLHFRVHSNLQALMEDSGHVSSNANHLVNEVVLSSDEDDAFFDVSEELMPQDSSAYNANAPAQHEGSNLAPIRKETTV